MIDKNIYNIIYNCCNLKKNDNIFLLYDNSTEEVLKLFTYFLDKKKINYYNLSIANVDMHGVEPISNKLKISFKYKIVISLTKFSIAHTKYRENLTKKKIKFLSLPFYSKKILNNSSLSVDFKKQTLLANKVGKILTKASHISLFSNKGTNFYFKKLNAITNINPGWCFKKEIIASPPDIEVNIPILGNSSYGKLVIDGSITCDEIGLLKKTLSIEIEDGKIKKIYGEKSKELINIFTNHNINKIMPAELGIGLNPKAKICGNMLIDEGSLGSVHIGFGSNSTIGGDKKISFHLDHIIRKPTLYCDNILLIKQGKINIE